MPHTSRKSRKKTTTKRVEITDEDGWTRVTTTNKDQRAPNPAVHHPPSFKIISGQRRTVPEPGASVDKVKMAYVAHEQQWLASESCKALVKVLKEQVLANGFHVDTCIMFGSASFCGVWQGWRERITAAFIQLAVFKTIQSTIASTTEQTVKAFAQDPAYNEIDIEFLQSIDVADVAHPDGFDLISQKSLVYTPGAEMRVEMEVLGRQPAILLTGKLDWYWRNDKGQACTDRVVAIDSVDRTDNEEMAGEPSDRGQDEYAIKDRRFEEECQTFEAFLGVKQSVGLPRFDYKDDPFYNQYLYWPSSADHGEEASLDSSIE